MFMSEKTLINDPYANAAIVLLYTNLGEIKIALRNDMPITTCNFKNLAQKGTFNGTIFHRVIPGFMIQGGDPTGTGYGDPSIPKIPDEFTRNNCNQRGTIAMANAGPNTGSSQFFINQVDNRYLDSRHPAFGKIVAGLDVVDKISKVPTDSNDRPKTNITIISASILP
jgi:peptidylprolyl isomerase